MRLILLAAFLIAAAATPSLAQGGAGMGASGKGSPVKGAPAKGSSGNVVPNINIEPSCRAATTGIAGAMTQSVEACRRSEQAARDILVKQWTSFNPGDRKSCYSLTTTGTPGTYTELLTCLEMRRDARALPDTTTIGSGLGR